MTTQETCEFLEWDTAFFGFRTARVYGNVLTPELVQEIDAFCEREKVRCLYFLASVKDNATTTLAERNGFHYADIRITFEYKLLPEKPVAPHPSNVVLRPAFAEDMPTLAKIAHDSYVDSRFYYDPHFSRDISGHLYEIWIKTSCEGYAQAVWVADIANEAVGYITCHVDDVPNRGRIGLVGVGANAQGHGIGKLLVQQGLAWFAGQGLPLATVVTQGRNLQAQRLYQRCGFVTQNVQLWYHKWYPDGNGV